MIGGSIHIVHAAGLHPLPLGGANLTGLTPTPLPQWPRSLIRKESFAEGVGYNEAGRDGFIASRSRSLVDHVRSTLYCTEDYSVLCHCRALLYGVPLYHLRTARVMLRTANRKMWYGGCSGLIFRVGRQDCAKNGFVAPANPLPLSPPFLPPFHLALSRLGGCPPLAPSVLPVSTANCPALRCSTARSLLSACTP